MKTLKSIKLIVLLTGSLTLPAQALCQTVSWTSSNPAVATVDAAGLVMPVSDGTTTITATTTQNGKTVTSVKTVEISLTPPPITINGVKWAIGNVTFDPSNCINGVCTRLVISSDPYERGFFFQWGGDGANVIGYPNGGAWNATPNVNDTSTWRYVQPGATFPGSWPSSGGVYNSNGTTKGEWTANNPCTLIGGGWRLPTKAECLYLHSSQVTGSYSMTGWTYSSANSGYFRHTAANLILPFSGRRNSSNGALESQSTLGYYLTSTESNTSEACYIIVKSTEGIYIGVGREKREGHLARCVQN